MSSRPTNLPPLKNAPQPSLPTDPLLQPTPNIRGGQLPPLQSNVQQGGGNSHVQVLTAKTIVWKAKKRVDPGDPNNWTNLGPSGASSSSNSLPPVAGKTRKIIEEVVGLKELGKVSAVAANEFISQVGEMLSYASAELGFSALPVVGGAVDAALGAASVGRGISNALDERHVNTAVSKMRPETAALCGRSVAKYFADKAVLNVKQGGTKALSGATNLTTGLTGVLAPLGTAASATGFGTAKALEIEALWTEFKGVQEANKYLAQGGVDATNYFRAAEVCPLVAAYVLASFPTADLDKISTAPGVIKQFRELTTEILVNSHFAIESGEQPPSNLARSVPDSSPRREMYMIDGGLVPDLLSIAYCPPKSAIMSAASKIGEKISSAVESVKDKFSSNSNVSDGSRSSSYAIGDPAGLEPPANRYKVDAQQAAAEGMSNQI